MKHRKSRVRKVGRKRRVFRKKKSGISAQFKHLVRIPKSLHFSFPDAMRTTVKFQWQAQEASASVANLSYAFWANSPAYPGKIGSSFIGATALSTALAPGTANDQPLLLATKNSNYFNVFMSAVAGNRIYNKCHVLNTTIRVRYNPLSLSDSLNVLVAPQNDSDSAIIASIGRADSGPYAKSRIITTSVPHMYVSNKINLPKYLGVTETAYISNPAYATVVINTAGTITQNYPATSGNEGGQVFWVIRRATLDGAVISATNTMPYEVEIDYDCLFHGLDVDDNYQQ